jgi:hypothetical protein
MKTLISLFLIFVGSVAVSAQTWSWMGEYPWIWSCEDESWQYVMPCGEGYYAYNYETDSWLTIGDVPNVGSPNGKTVTLSYGTDYVPVSSISFSDEKTSNATMSVNGSDVSCWWSGNWSGNSENSVFVLKTEDGYYFTITFNYTTDDSGSFVLLVPSQSEDASAESFMSIYTGSFSFE